MINKRVVIVAGILLFVFLVLVLKLFTIQIAKHEYYSRIAENQQYNPKIIKAERGLINDANGEVLCYSYNTMNFFAYKKRMDDKKIDSISSTFSRIMNRPKSYYKNLLNEGNGPIYLEKKVSMDKALKLKDCVVDGLEYEENFTRIYPYGNTASHILGYVDKKDGIGIEGIEKLYNKELSGTDGYYIYERDVLGRILAVDDKVSKNPHNGNTINLTINKNFQKILEEELVRGLQNFGGESAVGIIMNPNNGEILALANLPDFDPANYNTSTPESRRNRAVTDTYEPGSTMKSITMSIMFDNNLIKETDVINAENGVYAYKNVKIYDSHKHNMLTVREVLEQSSNIGMAKLIENLNPNVLYKYLRDFGFNNKTSVDLPSEADGYMKLPENFTGITKAFMSYGYEISTTPLQMISAYSALINGGTLFQPYVVKNIVDKNGEVVKENNPVKIRNVISKETSERMKKLLVGVVEHGTGTAAQLDNVLVGGKTGTAQRLVNNSYSSAHHNSSFVGFFPADNPKYVIYILVNAPTKGQYGGLVAAPIFHDAAKRIVDSDQTILIEKKKIFHDEKLVDQLIADIKTAPNSTQRSYLNIAENRPIKSNRVFQGGDSVPNLIGKSTRDAIAQLNTLGLKWKINGTGKVVWQSLEPGTSYTKGIACTLKCEVNYKNIKKSFSK